MVILDMDSLVISRFRRMIARGVGHISRFAGMHQCKKVDRGKGAAFRF